MKAQSDLGLYEGSIGSGTIDLKGEKWKTVICVSLPMAYVTQFLWGTDVLRFCFLFYLKTLNAFKAFKLNQAVSEFNFSFRDSVCFERELVTINH